MSQTTTVTRVITLRSNPESDVEQQKTPDKKTVEKSKPVVDWADDVVDNEHLNKRKSKSCCIHEKRRDFGESSSSSSSGSDSELESNGQQRPRKSNGQQRPR
ncbi:protein phosphatase inhibitor, partial [Gregarina niphandrodes]